MLILSKELSNKPLLSLRTASKIGNIQEPLINPHNLHIDGFICQVNNTETLYLLDINIREFSSKGVVINDHNDLSSGDELIRLQNIIESPFILIDKPIFDSNNKKLGRIIDYATEKESFYIQKLYVKPPIINLFNSPQLIIDRSSIIEITDKKIVVSGPEEKISSTNKALVAD